MIKLKKISGPNFYNKDKIHQEIPSKPTFQVSFNKVILPGLELLTNNEPPSYPLYLRAENVKKLREQTGFGMMDCKKALQYTEGDFEKAIEYLYNDYNTRR